MKIYVVGSSIKRFLPLDNIRQKFIVDEKHEGENIDNLNPWYCEMTGLYYLWKHVNDDIVGLEHYRRYFINEKRKLLSESEIKSKLSTSDIICVKAAYSNLRPVKTWINRYGKAKDFEKFLIFAKCYVGEEYYNYCNDMLNGTWHCLGNMFICKKELINEYCKFIFDLTKTYYDAEIQFGREVPKRILGYFTEFLFGAWLNWKQKKICWNRFRLT